jgi:uncharacterized repeat protein (TIGR03803 family)
MIFKITPAAVVTTLYSFCALPACTDGSGPQAGLLQAVNGDFYGLTNSGGANGKGTVFKVTASGALTILHSFCSEAACADGAYPGTALIQAANGDLYGTTDDRGSETGEFYATGTVFTITERGAFTTLYDFCHASYCAGVYPTALLQTLTGELYGTTDYAGAYGSGTVFKISPGGMATALYNFCTQDFNNACYDGNLPTGLIEGTDGNFYGAVFNGGANAKDYGGALFQITAGGAYSLVYSFCSLANCADGAWPAASPVQGTDGNFYGTTFEGGGECSPGAPHSCGTVYKLSLGLAPFVRTLPHSGKIGDTISILGANLTGTTAVAFNGVPAKFTVVSAAQITATVPSGAATGSIQVATPSGTLSSAGPFIVR